MKSGPSGHELPIREAYDFSTTTKLRRRRTVPGGITRAAPRQEGPALRPPPVDDALEDEEAYTETPDPVTAEDAEFVVVAADNDEVEGEGEPAPAPVRVRPEPRPRHAAPPRNPPPERPFRKQQQPNPPPRGLPAARQGRPARRRPRPGRPPRAVPRPPDGPTRFPPGAASRAGC